MGKAMTAEEFGEKVSGYYAMVVEGHLGKDDAEDAILDTLTAVSDDEREAAHDIHQAIWEKLFA